MPHPFGNKWLNKAMIPKNLSRKAFQRKYEDAVVGFYEVHPKNLGVNVKFGEANPKADLYGVFRTSKDKKSKYIGRIGLAGEQGNYPSVFAHELAHAKQYTIHKEKPSINNISDYNIEKQARHFEDRINKQVARLPEDLTTKDEEDVVHGKLKTIRKEPLPETIGKGMKYTFKD